MKPHHKIFLTSLALLLVVINAHCQDTITEGRIVYETIYQNSSKGYKPMTLHQINEVYRFMGKMERCDLVSKTKDSSFIIINGHKNEATALLNRNGTKTGYTQHFDSIDDYFRDTTHKAFKYLSETKIICGYKCKKAEYKIYGDKTKYYVYYTKDIIASNPYGKKFLFKDLNGFPMEYTSYSTGPKTIHVVTYISNEKVDYSIFDIPKDYEIINSYNR